MGTQETKGKIKVESDKEEMTLQELVEEPSVILRYPEYDGGSPYLADLDPVLEFMDGVRILADSDKEVDKQALNDFYEQSDGRTREAISYIIDEVFPEIRQMEDGSEQRVYGERTVQTIANHIWYIDNRMEFDDDNTCPYCGGEVSAFGYCDVCDEVVG